MSHTIKFLFCAPLVLMACTQPETQDPAPRASLVPVADQAAPDTTNLARPQPDTPICGHCKSDISPGAVADDDELSMIINSAYIGSIDDVVLVTYTSTEVNTYTFDSSVIDDLNDSQTYETIVMMDIPGTQRAKLIFSFASGPDVHEPITVE
jgi:hypothetical protein